MENAPPSAGEIRALAHQLMSWADQLSAATQFGRVPADVDRAELALSLATAARSIGRLRTRIFPDGEFANPAWAIMIEVFICEERGLRASLDRLAEEGGWAPLTVYRCVNLLIDKGLVERHGIQPNQDAVRLSLSPAGKRQMTEFLFASAEYSRPPSIGGETLAAAAEAR